MTDKEQIIIDGVDVNECKFLVNRFSNNTDYCCSELNNTFLKCPKRDCYFKQLARKTQECEELKKYIQEREVWGDHCEFCKHNDKENCHQNIILDNLKTINRYRKALDEIEEATKEISNYLNIGCDMDKCEDCNHFKPFCINQCVCFLIGQGDLILDIINKARGRLNEK